MVKGKDVKLIGIGKQYDQIAAFWNEQHLNSDYGVAQIEKALSYTRNSGRALDVGCGAGGRFVRKLIARGFDVTGLDASAEMIKLAQLNNPKANFVQANIENWKTDQTYDFILAWDCLFHLPLKAQKPVLSKLCSWLEKDGILIHSFGDAIGEHIDMWRGQEFAYSSIGIGQNIELLADNGLTCLHLELDQFPEKHVYAISVKTVR